jgi:hypothetical protein
MLPDFPAFGAGFNAFGTAYRPYQTFWPYLFVGEAHNEYLQLLLDTGLAGAAVGVHNLVEFNWQIPANAATFAAVAGLAVSGSGPQSLSDPVPAPAEVGRHRTPEAQGR